jgi:very-short-patch-repair endonuclease
LRVLRFTNPDVLEHIESVVESISEKLEKIPLSPPFSKGETS